MLINDSSHDFSSYKIYGGCRALASRIIKNLGFRYLLRRAKYLKKDHHPSLSLYGKLEYPFLLHL